MRHALGPKSTRAESADRVRCAMKKLHRSLTAVVAASSLSGVTARARAQDPMPGADLPTDARSPVTTRAHGVVAIPVLHSSPLLGTGFGGVGAVLFRLDSASHASSVGIGGVYSTRHSWLFAAASRAMFRSNRWTAAAGLELFDLNYDFFGVGVVAARADESVPVEQRGDAEVAEVLRRVYDRLYVGPRYVHRGVTTKLDPEDASNPLSPQAALDPDYDISALGGAAEYDSRDDEYAPRHGAYGRLSVTFARSWLGSDRAFDHYDGWINEYVALPSRRLLAFRLAACSVGSGAPIWDLCLYGLHADLRGYEGARYRDRAMFAAQGELRSPVVGRFGAALFGGVGTVAPSFSAVAANQLLPSAGLGVRYLASETRRVTLGADYAWGKDGGAFYFRIGEAF